MLVIWAVKVRVESIFKYLCFLSTKGYIFIFSFIGMVIRLGSERFMIRIFILLG